jgi:transcriptional regulator with XRE-family HTH domain
MLERLARDDTIQASLDMTCDRMGKLQYRRKRGVLLSPVGTRRLRQAIHVVEIAENEGQRLTAEALSNRIGVSVTTLSRLWAAKSGVDQRTLKLIFSAFNLELEAEDFHKARGDVESAEIGEVADSDTSKGYPSGPVPLNSPFYISRPPLESLAFSELSHPGCVIRIKAPTGFGKSSLLLRILHQSEKRGFATAEIDLRQADLTTLAEARLCLQWLCVILSLKLNLEPRLEDYWSELVGDSLSATLYLREYLLPQVDRPLVLAMNELNRIFEHSASARTLLPLLRSWHEEAKHDNTWEKLRLVVIYSTDVYLPLDINQSPFNVGLPLTLSAFTPEQVQTLATLHGLAWDDDNTERLVVLLGGHPALVRIALYHLSQGELSLEELLASASTCQGIYKTYLQQLLDSLQTRPHLLECLKPLVMADRAIALEPMMAYQLEGLGLIKSTPTGWQISCELYRAYLQQYL